jgi:hypothetical protein
MTHNANVDRARQIIQLAPAASPDGTWQLKAQVDLLALARKDVGYIAAWKADPVGMSGATLLDLIAIGGTAYLYDRSVDEKTTISKPDAQPTYDIQAENVIINRDGTVNYTRSGE